MATGEPVAGSYTVAGNAVGFAPAASLIRGQEYRWQAGHAIEDLAGNHLGAAKTAAFRVGELASAAAPSLDALPALFCGDRLVLTGTASPGATVKVRDGSLTLATFADAAGKFRLELPLASQRLPPAARLRGRRRKRHRLAGDDRHGAGRLLGAHRCATPPSTAPAA